MSDTIAKKPMSFAKMFGLIIIILFLGNVIALMIKNPHGVNPATTKSLAPVATVAPTPPLPPDLARAEMADSYLKMMNKKNRHMNFIRTKLIKVGKG